MLDILNIEPHKVSRDLRGYCVMLYGDIKTGKTTTATKFPNSLLLAFEKGYNAIPGVIAQPINSWGEFKKVARQLKKDEAKARYETIIIDTADIAYEYAEKYILNQNGAQKMKDIEYGAGYGMVEREFDENMRDIVKMGYGLVFISHSQDKVFKDENGEEYNQITTTLDKRGHKVTTRMTDILGYVKNMDATETDPAHVRMFMRGTPRYVAGSRFEFMDNSIVFNYENLVGAIEKAVDKLEESYGKEAVSEVGENLYAVKETDVTMDDLQTQFQEIAKELVTKDKKYKVQIGVIVDKHLGIGNKINEATPQQYEMVEQALSDLIELQESVK